MAKAYCLASWSERFTTGRLGRGSGCRLVMDDTQQSKKLADEVLPITQWSPWWIGMWVAIAAALLTSVFFMGVWHWLTLTLFAFGIPEFIGTLKQDDRYPPLTHVIVRYVDREIAFPLLVRFRRRDRRLLVRSPTPTEHGVVGRPHRLALSSLRSSVRAVRRQEVETRRSPRLRTSRKRSV